MKQVLLIGAARSGVACAKLLAKHGYHCILTDAGVIPQKAELEALGIACFEEGHPKELFDQRYDFVVKNPGIPYKAAIIQQAMSLAVPIYTEVEIATWFAKHYRYAAVSGTNGKTTVTTILGEMLMRQGKGAIAGNIGIPLSELVLSKEDEALDVAIELSNFQLLGMETFAPKVSIITNLAPDHLDYMGSVEAYYASKLRIYAHQQKSDYFIFNLDDETLKQYVKEVPATIVTLSLHQEADVMIRDGRVYYKEVVLFDVGELKIVGTHNLFNAMSAAVMAYLMGVSLGDIQDVLYCFKGVKHRLQFVGEKHGISFYNDSKATNPSATRIALEAFDKNIILLAGGYDKKISFEELHAYDERVKMCIGYGQCKEQIAATFTHHELADDLAQAFARALQIAKPNDVVLLAPACASFDQFKNFEERGELFITLVEHYLDQTTA